MSWMAKLYETYENISENDDLNKEIEPYFHKKEQCHIEIIIDDHGNFIRAESLISEVAYGKQKYWKGEDTIIPITPKSLTGRTSGAAPYPLAEQIQYVAKDYPDYGGTKKSYFNKYFELLNSWAESDKYSHFKVAAVAKYVSKGKVVCDLLRVGILFAYEENNSTILINKWAKQGPVESGGKRRAPKPPLLNAVSGNEQGNAKIRWRVQRAGDPDDSTWDDQKLACKWQVFQGDENKANGFCQILGKECFVFNKHPKGIIPKVNDAKLISTPSDKGYITY
ncbi:MAG: type I-C CRISPR-associated protein Cas8c/Csd1, partial [Deltaproteobacteria bacterium]|nr:type I-C CRISPR-associated protein Cas8c/Csd1 [Deltaproteobacteria bacterium]